MQRGHGQSVRIEYKPTPKQRMFHASTAKEILYGGAAGGGKSKAIVMDALMRCLRYPGTHAYIFRRTYPELLDSNIKEARASIPEDIGRYSDARKEIALVNGSVIHFKHCAHESDLSSYRGVEIHWLYVDELTTFTQQMYDFLKTRLRAAKNLNIEPVIRCASNPGDIGHGWVKSRFVDRKPYMAIHDLVTKAKRPDREGWVESRSTIQYIPSLATENPHITQDYINQLMQKPAALQRAYLHGDWDAFEGQVFMEFKDDPEHYHDGAYSHVIDPFRIPAHWARYMSFDWGYSRPFSVGWWAIAPDGTAYRYKEWYGCEGEFEDGRRLSPNIGMKLSPSEVAEGILEREEDERQENIHIIRIADPSIFDASRGPSIAQQMASLPEGRYVTFQPGDNERLAGKMQMHERLRFDENGRARMYVFRNCMDFIRTIPTLPYDTSKVEDVDTDAEDHIFDECRYFLMARPLPLPEPRKRRRRVFDPLDLGVYEDAE